MSAYRIVVEGRVQGVGYRAWAVRTANLFSLSGWVRNRHDGSVEILASGSPEALEAFILRCHQGPHMSEVENVIVKSDDGDDVQGGLFDWRETA